MTGIPDVRGAVLADATAITALSGTLGYPAAADAAAHRLELHVVLVAAAGDRVIGWLHAVELDILDYGTRCDILGLVVDAEYRRGGVGRRLVEGVEERTSARGIDRIAVRSSTTRSESHPSTMAAPAGTRERAESAIR
jgi:GNAT superfamily N-acetyltransferase